jgi:hypothetical protein
VILSSEFFPKSY